MSSGGKGATYTGLKKKKCSKGCISHILKSSANKEHYYKLYQEKRPLLETPTLPRFKCKF